MLVQVEAVAKLALLDDEMLGLLGFDDTARMKTDFGIQIAVPRLAFDIS